MMLSLLQNKAMYLQFTQAAVCLTVTEIVGNNVFNDRRTYSHHHILPDKSDIAARITSLLIDSSCRHPFEGPFTAVSLKWGRFLGNGSGTCATHFDSSSSKKLAVLILVNGFHFHYCLSN